MLQSWFDVSMIVPMEDNGSGSEQEQVKKVKATRRRYILFAFMVGQYNGLWGVSFVDEGLRASFCNGT